MADRAYDADKRVLERLEQQGKTVVIPPKRNRTIVREYDQELYKVRHLVDNFFAKRKQYRAIATRCDKRGRSEGAGLGLSIVRAIAIAHGGKVTVRSQLGSGSTFEIVLPLQSLHQG